MIHPEFVDPPREFGLCPFWFWNDKLDEVEIARQMGDFQTHGVHAFVIHPRVGLPREIGWMSDAMGGYVRFAVEEAARRGMTIVLYDEGMYPSGSSCGQVVAENPAFRCHGLDRTGTIRPVESTIRGLHYVGEGPEEDAPPAADLLNPAAVECFIRLVYDRYREWVGDHFGTTVKGIFTDEPSLLGRTAEDVLPATPGHPVVGDVWNDPKARAAYEASLKKRLEETYYRRLSDWCRAHGLALMGHPEAPDDPSPLRFFDVPGQDLVWRWVLPGSTALEGPQSAQAKAAASVAKHSGKRRNSNELCGAYGHELTFAEFKWLVDWCAVRGTNLFFPHAFYYSLRGPRKDERPPDVGPNSPWWAEFASFARYCARLCWLNTDSEHVCDVALLESEGRFPWEPAKALFQSQVDFDYLSLRDLPKWGSRYAAIVDGAPPANLPRTLEVESHPDLRVRHVRKAGWNLYLVHNEGAEDLDLAVDRGLVRIDPMDLKSERLEDHLRIGPHKLVVLAKREAL